MKTLTIIPRRNGFNAPQLSLRPVLSNDVLGTEIKHPIKTPHRLLSDFCDDPLYYVSETKYSRVRRMCYVFLFSLHYVSLFRPTASAYGISRYAKERFPLHDICPYRLAAGMITATNLSRGTRTDKGLMGAKKKGTIARHRPGIYRFCSRL